MRRNHADLSAPHTRSISRAVNDPIVVSLWVSENFMVVLTFLCFTININLYAETTILSPFILALNCVIEGL